MQEPGWQLPAAALPYVFSVLGVGGAISTESARQQQKQGKPAPTPMTPAPSLPPLPPSEPPRDRTPPREEFPGTPLPPTDVPGFTPQDLPNVVEVYPEQQVTAQDLILDNRRGGPATQAANQTVGGAVDVVTKTDDLPIKIIAGGGVAEKLLRAPGETTSSKDGSYSDTWAQCETTGRNLHVNTVDVRADGVTPSTREAKAAVRIMRNKKSGDILILLPKLPNGQQYDQDAIADFLRPYLIEICDPMVGDGPNTREPIRPPRWPLW